MWPGSSDQVRAAARAEYSRRLAIACEAARNQVDAAELHGGDGGTFDFELIRAGIMAELGLEAADVAELFSGSDTGRAAAAPGAENGVTVERLGGFK